MDEQEGFLDVIAGGWSRIGWNQQIARGLSGWGAHKGFWGSRNFGINRWIQDGVIRQGGWLPTGPMLKTNPFFAGNFPKENPAISRRAGRWLREKIYAPYTSEERIAGSQTRAYMAFQKSALTASWESGEAASAKGGLGQGIRTFSDTLTKKLAQQRITGVWGKARFAGSALGTAAVPIMNALFVADLTKYLAGGLIDSMIEIGKPRDITPRFYQSPENFTMRQAGLQAIHTGILGTRNAFAREASALHM